MQPIGHRLTNVEQSPPRGGLFIESRCEELVCCASTVENWKFVRYKEHEVKREPGNDIDKRFSEFVQVVRRLRLECPWDREQTHRSLRQYLLEEAYESVEAIEENDMNALKKELGDLLLQVVLHSVMAEQENAFSISDVIESESEKMIRRHPHVFGEVKVSGSTEVLRNWEHIKQDEGERTSYLDGVPAAMAALLRASRIQGKASKVGFDWRLKADVWKKVVEEVDELHHAEATGNETLIEEEFGDVFFALVNYSRFLKIEPESALNHATEKFIKRFHHIEARAKEEGKDIKTMTLEEMDAFWDEAKEKKIS
jgi:MazG family protein